jgi:hypothetical protein
VFWLTSRLTGKRHYVRQTRDTIADNGRAHPVSGQRLYNAKASYAMGRCDGDPANGTGPNQTRGCTPGFSHTDRMDCVSCHAAWTNTCVGCHLEGEYDTGNNFSNITGERIVFRQKIADFTYQSPVPFQLGVDADNKITQVSTNTKVFFRYEDIDNNRSRVFAFTDRNGGGNNPNAARRALGHNALMAHSIRGRVEPAKEGPRYCVACHYTDNALSRFRPQLDAMRTALAGKQYGSLDFALLAQHIGRNPGNQLDSPLWVHMVAGLGSGLFLFDENGCPQNPLDGNANRVGCEGNAPKDNFDPARVFFDLDRIVEPSGAANASGNHPLLRPGQGPLLRDGASNPNLTGPLGAILIRRLADPDAIDRIVLDSWLDADGALKGDAGLYVR